MKLTRLVLLIVVVVVVVPAVAAFVCPGAPRRRRHHERSALHEAVKPNQLEQGLVEDWCSIAARERMTDRVRKLETTATEEAMASLDALVAAAPVDEAALARDWERLRRECAYLDPDALDVVRDALVVAYAAHAHQRRRSGEPFVVHPVAVASLLAGLQMDCETVAAGLLHDTVEDTDVTFEQLESRYGASLRKIVEGETKVSKLPKLAMSQQPRPLEEEEEDEDEDVVEEAWPVVDARPPPPRHVVDDTRPLDDDVEDDDAPPLAAAAAVSCSSFRTKEKKKKKGAMMSAALPLFGKKKKKPRAPAAAAAAAAAKVVDDDDAAFSIAEEQAENLRQMFIAMTDDYRIIIVKLADRLHNMRTLEHMPRHKQRKIARETLEIFAPLAHRLGIWQFKAELEEIAFRYAHPREHETLRAAIAERRPRYDSALAGSKAELERSFASDAAMRGVTVSVSGRTKELYSLWLKLRKMAAAAAASDENNNFDVDAVQDVVALRVVLDVPKLSPDEPLDAWRERSVWLCYRALSLVQHLDQCEAVPEQGVKDYISFPKPNFYQSLHVFARRKPENQIVEIQIRTRWMHEIAEHGMAAHWLYKESFFGDHNKNKYAVAWLESVKTWQHEIRSSTEFIDTIRRELLGKRVFVFLRDGKILDLSRGATVLDAAFHIHTDVGLRARAAFINGREVQFSYELRNGDVVSIVTSPDAYPQLDWMRWAHRRSTRSKLRAYFKQRERRAKEGIVNHAYNETPCDLPHS
ncbi:hypothetical protein CTAYLR_004248 [Chrysophaeum taylorii]|uniref:Putative GTP diphosphokinase RSH1, chloroplastic n=1 Tax=Chrysophaeum taylorii TaxID=2483200 RepID=A0AAD7XL64_9STRA|nr:hypothetical protein CTAYLR_004248 [Chrysophaeum taylorii]